MKLNDLTSHLINESNLEESLPYFKKMATYAHRQGNHTLETKAYRFISETYMHKMDSTKSLEFAKKALTIRGRKNNLSDYLLNINQLGRVYHHFQNYEKAIESYNLGIAKYDANLDKDILKTFSNLYSNSSLAYDKLGMTEKSVQRILKGIDIAEKTNNINQKSYGLYALGYKYMVLKNYSKAEEYFLKSLTYSDSVSFTSYVYMNHHGLGINYSRWGKYDKALYHNNLALDFFRRQGDELYEFDVLNNTAVVYERMNEPDSILKYATLALDLAKKINHQLAINGAKMTLSNAYIKLKNYNKAQILLFELAKDTNNTKFLDKNSKLSLFANLSKVYEGKKDYKKSLEYHKRFKNLNDSIEKEIKNSKLLETENKYRLEQKNNTILSQSLEIEKWEKQRTKLFAVIFIISMMGISLGYIIYKNKRQRKIDQKAYENELNKLKQLRNEIYSLYKEQKQNIENLEKTIVLTSEKLKNDFEVNEESFHIHLKDKYNLSKALLEFWILQVNGFSENQMKTKLNIKSSGIETRRKRLYQKLKEIENIDLSERQSRIESLQIYRENYRNFFT